MRQYGIWLLGCLILGGACWLWMHQVSVSPSSVTKDHIDANGLFADISAKLAEMHPGHPEYSKTLKTLKKVRQHLAGTHPRPTDPGAFRQALAEVKLAHDGRTYSPDYRIRALDRALKSKKRRLPQLDWVERGPGNVSGRARAVLVDPDDPQMTWLVASVGGGIWKTADGGTSWQDKTPMLTALSTMCMASCESQPDTIYVGTGMGYGRIVDLEGSGVWKSTDRGETWMQLESTAHGEVLEAINRILVHPQDPDLVLLCSNDTFSHLGTKGGERRSGIFRSSDGGQSWTQVFDPDAVLGTETDNRVQQILAHPQDFNILFASINEVGVIKSSDAGLTWRVVADDFALPSDIGNPPNDGTSFYLGGVSVRTELAISDSDPRRLYAAVERPRGVADLYMSGDTGETWQLVRDTGNDPNWFNAYSASGATGNYCAGWFNNTIVVNPYDPNVVFVGGVNLYRLNINPTSRTRTSTLSAFWIPGQGVPYAHADHHFLCAVPTDAASQRFMLLDANDGGLAVSTNSGANWVQLTGMETTQFYGADKKPGQDVYIGGMQDNGTWHSPLNSTANSAWFNDLGGDGFEAAWHATDGNLVLGCSQYGNLSRSIDGGSSWQPVSGAGIGNSPFITKIANSEIDPDLVMVIGDQGVNRSEDFGLTWSRTPVQGNWLGYRPFDNIEISLADPQVVWITSKMAPDPPSMRTGGVHVSVNGGLSFTEISQQLPPTLVEASGLATDPLDRNTAYLLFSAAGDPKVLRTRDLGETWTDLSQFDPETRVSQNGFPDVAVFSLLVMPFDRNIIWAGTEIGLFVSTDDGASWEYADQGLPAVGVFEMRIVDDQVVVATQGRGIWSVTLPELADISLPEVPLAPRILAFGMHPNGMAQLKVDLRSAYDQTQILLDGEPIRDLGANAGPYSTTFWLDVTRYGVTHAQLTSRVQGRDLLSSTQSAQLFATELRSSFETDFTASNAPDDFILDGFTVTQPDGFNSRGLHSPHPYALNREYTAQLRWPIEVRSAACELSYDDVVLVEPGTGSGQFGDAQFWDFVIVEGSKDGATWLPLADGYDSRSNAAWLSTYQSGNAGRDSLSVRHTLDLLETFSPGDQVFIRFRLYSDAGVVGWGWSIDNLSIQSSGESHTPTFAHLYPWMSHNEQFESTLVADNPSDTDMLIYLQAIRSETQSWSTVRSIPPHGMLREDMGSLFPDMDSGSGCAVTATTEHPDFHGRWVTYNLAAGSGQSPAQGVAIQVQGDDLRDWDRRGQRLLFSFLPVSQGFTSAPVIVNTSTQPADVVLRCFDSQGAEILSDTTTLEQLPPGVPFAAVVTDLIPGWTEDLCMIAESTAPLTGVNFVFNTFAEPAIGNVISLDAPPITQPSSTRLIYPWLSYNHQFQSLLVANNVGSDPATVQVEATRENGETVTTEALIPAGGFLRAELPQLFPTIETGSGWTAVLTSDDPDIMGSWVTYNLHSPSGKSPSMAMAIPAHITESSRLGHNLVLGFLPVRQGWTAAPVLVNLGDAPADVVLDIYDTHGFLVKTDETTLAGLEPGRPFARVINTLTPDALNDVFITARCQDQAITGVGFVFNSAAEPAMGNASRLELRTP